MTNSSDRLDRIEAILERTAQQQSRLDSQLELLADRVGEIAQSTSDLRHSMNELRQDREETWAAFNRFMGIMVQFQEQANADRAIMLENQTEIRRIWEYLMRQHPNGQGG
jgi:uncharacterized protein involved in exopolysaccharide biosynthesis